MKVPLNQLVMLGCMIAVCVVVFVIVGRRVRRAGIVSPRQRKRHGRRTAMFYSLPVCLLALAMQMHRDPTSAGTFLLGGVVGMLVISLLFTSPEKFSVHEAMVNYAKDPAHCGQCEYDLTGNESGICPECGWQIPNEIPLEYRDYVPWPVWWKRWEIQYVENWPRMLAKSAIFTVLLAGLTVAMALSFTLVATVPTGIVCVMWLINVYRLIVYGRRVSNARS